MELVVLSPHTPHNPVPQHPLSFPTLTTTRTPRLEEQALDPRPPLPAIAAGNHVPPQPLSHAETAISPDAQPQDKQGRGA
jgi:hypothetical protein